MNSGGVIFCNSVLIGSINSPAVASEIVARHLIRSEIISWCGENWS